MIRRKAKDYGGSSLELGGATNLIKYVPMKRRMSVNVVRYLILILLGVILHAGYKLMVNSNSEREYTGSPHDDVLNDDVAEITENALKDSQNIMFDEEWEHKEKIENKLKMHSKTVLEKQMKSHKERASVAKSLNPAKDVNTIDDLKSKNDKRLSKQNLDKGHQSNEIEYNDIIGELDPKDNTEIEDLKNEMKIENQIAKLMDEDRNLEKLSEVPVEESTDPKKPVQRDPKVQKEFQQKADQIVRVVKGNVQSVVLSEGGHHSHEIPVFVTAASQQTFGQIEHLVASIQYFYPQENLYIFDLDLTDDQRKKLSSFCNVRMRGFWFNLFPKFIQDLSNFHWRPLIIQTALAEFGHITWINPGLKVSSTVFSELVHKSEDPGVLIIGQSADYSTFAVTNPGMYKYLAVDRTDLFKFPHIEIKAMIIHNNDDVMNHFMKILTACAVDERCLSPFGASSDCTFDVTGREYANCHRFDESAVNIILKNWLGHKPSSYMVKSTFLQPINKYDRVNPKICNE